MSVGEIYDCISMCSSETILKCVKKMLKDHELGIISIPSSIADIEKVKSICQTIENSKRKKISGPQDYCIKFLFAEGICCYYDIKCKDDVRNAYMDMQTKC